MEKILKGEHFSGNNPDMKLYFEKPDKAEIDMMNYNKPTTIYEEIPKSEAAMEKPIYMDGKDVMSHPNCDFIADKSNYAPGSKSQTLSSGGNQEKQ